MKRTFLERQSVEYNAVIFLALGNRIFDDDASPRIRAWRFMVQGGMALTD
jgi:hypothetical protein